MLPSGNRRYVSNSLLRTSPVSSSRFLNDAFSLRLSIRRHWSWLLSFVDIIIYELDLMVLTYRCAHACTYSTRIAITGCNSFQIFFGTYRGVQNPQFWWLLGGPTARGIDLPSAGLKEEYISGIRISFSQVELRRNHVQYYTPVDESDCTASGA